MAGSSHPNRLKALCVFYVFGLVTSQSLVPNIAAMPRDPLLLTSAMMPNFTSTYTNLPLKPQHLLQRRQDTCYAPNYVCNGGTSRNPQPPTLSHTMDVLTSHRPGRVLRQHMGMLWKRMHAWRLVVLRPFDVARMPAGQAVLQGRLHLPGRRVLPNRHVLSVTVPLLQVRQQSSMLHRLQLPGLLGQRGARDQNSRELPVLLLHILLVRYYPILGRWMTC